MLFTKSKARTFEYIAQVSETVGKNDSTTKYLTQHKEFQRNSRGYVISEALVKSRVVYRGC
jgi:hypothetical protein